jgi:phytoene/squalene synthetase
MKRALPKPLGKRTGETVKTVSPFSYYFGRLFFVSERREILYKAYGYFRWLDDIVDQAAIPRQQADEIIQRQSQLIAAWYEGRDSLQGQDTESLMKDVIQCNRPLGCPLRPMARGFLDALSWDVQRRYTIVEQEALDRYSQLLGCSYAHGLLFGFGLSPVESRYQTIVYLGGVASHLSHMIRDYEEDRELGYINISREALRRFQIDLDESQSANVRRWKRSLARKACAMFREARKQRNTLPTARARIGFDLVSSRYYRIARRLAET